MNIGKVFSISLLSLVLLLLAGLVSCSGDKKEAVAKPEVVRGETTYAQRANVPDYLEAVGTVRASQSSQVASQMMGNIVEIRVHEGDRVQRGQILAVIEDAQARAAHDRATAAAAAAQQEVQATQSDLNLSETTLKRYQDLFDKKSVSPQEFDEVKARFQSAQARHDMARAGEAQAQAALAQARTALDYTRLRAPFDGFVTEKKADAGTLASPGMPLFTVEDPRRYRLEAAVDEADIALVRIGAPAPVHIDAFDAQLAGKVVQIVPAADPATRSFLVKIDLPADARLRSGLFGRAQFVRGERTSVVVPRSAVVQRGQLQGVYVVDSNHVASLRYVTLGRTSGEQVEILSGLDGNEQIIALPADRDLGGKRIEAQR
jgi:RND family efflux transporter MFP subunit